MAEHEVFTDSGKQSLDDDSNRFLITQERTDKLELIIHLIAKLTHVIVVCGSHGIGKTTLLTALKNRTKEPWHYYWITGAASLNSDSIQAMITDAMRAESTQNSPNKIILLIDNAGLLAPKLISNILNIVADHPILSVIFALTHDELALKNHSDSAIDTALFVEIPPLSEQQCGNFLHYLAQKNKVKTVIDDNQIEAIYQQTHGIPAKIIAQMPSFATPKSKNDRSLWLLITAVITLITITLGIQSYSAADNKTQAVTPLAVEAVSSQH